MADDQIPRCSYLACSIVASYTYIIKELPDERVKRCRYHMAKHIANAELLNEELATIKKVGR
jgi:hypothetical protein